MCRCLSLPPMTNSLALGTAMQPMDLMTPAQTNSMFSPNPVDLADIELMLLAMEQARDNVPVTDIHLTRAAQLFGVTEDAVTPEQRRYAKTLNVAWDYITGPMDYPFKGGFKRG